MRNFMKPGFRGAAVLLTVAVAALVIFGCEFLLGPDDPGGAGNLVISLGESGPGSPVAANVAAGRAAVPTAEEQALLRYELALIGPGGQKINVSLAPGETFNEQVALGRWRIYAEAYNPINDLIGTGSAAVRVGAGKNEARVRMVLSPLPGDQMTRIISNIDVPFRYVPAGSFMLKQDGTGNPSPDLTMTISRGYWMGETEVTQELFAAVMGGERPSSFTSNPEDSGPDGWKKLPVEQVSWYAAIAFCNKLSLADGKDPVYSVNGVSNWGSLAYGDIPTASDVNWDAATMETTKNGYRLPTEMEWMWAAMGADTNVQPDTTGYTKGYAGSTEGAGQTNIGNYAWYTDNASNKTHQVGQMQANELGLYDMSGNVYVWCWDWYGSYPSGEETDYTGSDSGPNRVLRGGAFMTGLSASYCVVANRSNTPPSNWNTLFGIRVVCP
jgi:formylglycine-generating enzyme required for sulfatase activity